MNRIGHPLRFILTTFVAGEIIRPSLEKPLSSVGQAPAPIQFKT
jgi:hypothetical protein